MATTLAAPASGGRFNSLHAALLIASAAAAALTAYGAMKEDVGDGVGPWLVGLAAIGVAAIVTYKGAVGALAPGNASGASRRAIIFGVLAVVTLPVFWLGIYAPFAAGAVVAGAASFNHGGTGRQRLIAGAGIVLGVVGFAVNALANIFG